MLIFRFLCAMTVLLLTGGCNAFYTYRPVPFVITDAETGEGIGGAKVSASYRTFLDIFRETPKHASGTTNVAGVAELSLADTDHPLYVCAGVTDYLPTSTYLRRAHSAGHGPPPAVRIELYRAPAPTIILHLPENYVGPVELLIENRDDPANAGVRQFEVAVSGEGKAVLASRLACRHHYPIDVRLADGTTVTGRGNSPLVLVPETEENTSDGGRRYTFTVAPRRSVPGLAI